MQRRSLGTGAHWVFRVRDADRLLLRQRLCVCIIRKFAITVRPLLFSIQTNAPGDLLIPIFNFCMRFSS